MFYGCQWHKIGIKALLTVTCSIAMKMEHVAFTWQLFQYWLHYLHCLWYVCTLLRTLFTQYSVWGMNWILICRESLVVYLCWWLWHKISYVCNWSVWAKDITMLRHPRKCKQYKIFCTSAVLKRTHCCISMATVFIWMHHYVILCIKAKVHPRTSHEGPEVV